MQLSIIIDANGNAAIQTVERLGGAVKKTGAATQEMGRSSDHASRSTRALGNSASATDAAVDALSASQTRNAATAKAMGQANRTAAGNMGNLVAQFNDIGVMMAAGQNPLTLALQQGTQISQVIGPMGAAGAVKSLGGAFLGMLNPISLVTIGTIAAGAALSQWVFGAISAGKETKTFEDSLQDLSSATERYQEATDIASASTAELDERFGAAAGSIKTTLNLLQDLAQADAQRAIDGLAGSIANLMNMSGDGDQRFAIADFFDVNIGLALTDAQRTARAEARTLTAEFANQQVALQAANGDLDQQIAIMQQLLVTAESLALATDGRSASEDALLVQLSDALIKMQQQRGAVVDAAQQGKAAYDQYYASRIASENQLAGLHQAELTTQAAIYGLYAQSRAESDAGVASAGAMLDAMIAQNNLQQAILSYGEDSAQVTALRAAEERAAFEETLATLDVSEELKDQLRGALIVQQDIASIDMTPGINGAIFSAEALAEKLGTSLQIAQAIARVGGQAGSTGPDQARNQVRDALLPNGVARDSIVSTVNIGPRFSRSKTRTSGGRSGGSRTGGGRSKADEAARELERQREAVTNLITSLDDELAILRETDPIQKEMLRNRENLAAATTEERSKVEELITARAQEEAAIARHTELYDGLRSAGSSAFDALRQKGGGIKSMLESLSGSIQDMIFQAALLGEGPLGTGGGGLLGTIANAIIPSIIPGAAPSPGAPLNAIPALARADGGMIYGPGTGTSDSILTLLSNGEFVSTAKATSKYRPMLEAMNAGTLPRFAQGGIVGAAPANVPFAPVNVSWTIENNSSTPIQGQVEEQSDGRGGRKFKMVLSDQVASAINYSGGAADKALRARGAQPARSLR